MSNLLQVIQAADLSVYHFLNGSAGNWFLNRVESHAEANNLLRGGLFLAAYWYLWFRDGPDRDKRRRVIIVVFVATMLAVVLARTLALATPSYQSLHIFQELEVPFGLSIIIA